MKAGLVGYQGGGKSALFELLTGLKPDPSKTHSGQVGVATVPDERFDRLVDLYQPKKIVPTKIELFDTPGLSRDEKEGNAQRLSVIREASVLVQVIGQFAGCDPTAEASAFIDDLILADSQVVSNRVERLKKDAAKPRPDRDELQAELEALLPIAERLENGDELADMEFSEAQVKAASSFALLTRKRRLVVLNTADSDIDAEVVANLESAGHAVIAAPAGLELEVLALPEEEQAEFGAEMGLAEPSRRLLLRKIFEVTDQITFYTCAEKEVHAWLLNRGETVLDAADTIHSDLARGFVRAEIW
ncbi:MAG: redox-regulated ATPase YchF, partial [Planctomycetaceae bacterium]|nr:redox-regulated ATPase YchF [Planctomycetaceae bacterium]